MPFRKNDRVEFDNAGVTVRGVVEKGGATPKVVVDGRRSYYRVPEGRLRHSNHPIPPEDRAALGLDGPSWKAGDRVMFPTRDAGTVHGTVTRTGAKLKVVQDGGTSEWSVPPGAVKASDAEIRKDTPHEMDRYGLSGYREAAAMSEETVAFTATLTVDGRRFAEARNDGRGSCNFYHAAHGGTRDDVQAFEETAAKWLSDMGMPDRFNNEAADFWLSWKATQAPFNCTAADAVRQHVDQMKSFGLAEDGGPAGP